MKVLIKGWAGFIGSHIKSGDAFLCLDNFREDKQGVEGGEYCDAKK